MTRFASRFTGLLLLALASGCADERGSGSVANDTPVTSSPQPDADKPVRTDGSDNDKNHPAESSSEVAGPADPSVGAAGPPVGSLQEGAPLHEPFVVTREQFLALMQRNEDLRADIRTTNAKLQRIMDGEFEAFEKLLDEEPRLATLRWGYYEDKPDPLNPFNPPPRHGPDALHLAAEHGAMKLVRRLAQPDRMAPDSGGESALEVAATIEIAEVLLAAGARIAPPEAGALDSPFRLPAARGDLELCKWIKARAPEANLDIEVVNGQHWRPIGFACEAGHLDVVQWLQSEGVPLTLIPGTLSESSGWGIYSAGSSPLARAAAGGQLHVLEYLLANGADVNVRTERKPHQPSDQPDDIEYSAALCRAAAEGHAEVVQRLLDEGAQVNSRGALNPLHMAAMHGQENVFQLLLRQGAKITTDKYVARLEETSGIDLVCCAVRGGNLAIFKRVIDEWPSPWLNDEWCSNRMNSYRGRGPLAIAVSEGHELLVRHILTGPEFADAPERAELLNHALATAVEMDRVEMVKRLRDAGASFHEPLIKPSPGSENANQPILVRAAAHGSLEVLRYLVGEGLDVDATDADGRTVMHLVCRRQFAPQTGLYADRYFRIALIQGLLALGASPQTKDASGRSLLHDAAFFLEPEEVSLLLEHGASPRVFDEHAETPAAMCERLLAGNYRSDSEPRPWHEELDKSAEERTLYSWHERIRMENNLETLRANGQD